MPANKTIRNEYDAIIAARESVLRLLGMTTRPLRWAELQAALGLLTQEARSACEWLMDHGYIAAVRTAREAKLPREAVWVLGDKGRDWAAKHGALSPARA